VKHRALIVDDERLARASLRKLLETRGDVDVVGEADSVEAAMVAIVEATPDVVFLDVQMPGGSGFDLFERAEVRARVVFVTAYDQHALRAFAVNALDYLLKPVDPAELARSIARLAVLGQGVPVARLALDDVVCLPQPGGMRFVRLRDVVCITAAEDYSEVQLSSGKILLAEASLRRWEQRLPEEAFVRIHRSSLVNLCHAGELVADGTGAALLLRDGTSRLAVSRRSARALRARVRTLR
jgi:two-component system LytT family response regulator